MRSFANWYLLGTFRRTNLKFVAWPSRFPSTGKFRQQTRPTPNKFPQKSFNPSCFLSPDLKRDIAELPNRSSVIDICVDRRGDESISPKICILHGLWRPTRERQKVFPFITLFYCRLLSLVQMAKISIISSHETSFPFVFWLGSGEQKFSLIVKSIRNVSKYRSETFVMPMLSN